MITPRATRLVRVPDLQAFRETVVALACEGAPLDAHDRLVVVPTRAAAAHLVRSIEDAALPGRGALVLPEIVTPSELVDRLADRLPPSAARLTPAEREVLLGVSARFARDAGCEPPFRLRPALVAEMLRFYDALRLNGKDVDTFERLALGILEPGAPFDRGADRLVRQTRFLAVSFRDFERRCAGHGVDPHRRRQDVLATSAARPFRHAVVAVRDAAFDPYGLLPAHWDLLARVPGLERLDLVVTETTLAGACHERLHQALPGIDEVRLGAGERRAPRLVGADAGAVHVSRDREDEIADCARRVKRMARVGTLSSLDRAAIVVKQPLPYVYVAREVLRAGGVPSQLFDALPLAAEPYAAALDLVVSFVASGFGRSPAIALLRSPVFRFVRAADAGPPPDGGLSPNDVSALDRALADAGYSGGLDALERLVPTWSDATAQGRAARAGRAGAMLLDVARVLAPLRDTAPAAAHLGALGGFLTAYERVPGPADPLLPRHLRARAAVLGTIESLRAAYERLDAGPIPFDDVGALLRRWIEGQTFAPLTGEGGVHVVDADSARFGGFDLVHVAGLVEGEWPERPRRNIFYSTGILRQLGWPADSDRLDGARAAFRDLLRLPQRWLVASTFALEADSIVGPSPLLEEVERAGLEIASLDLPPVRIFEEEALTLAPPDDRALSSFARAWLGHRQQSALAAGARRDPGMTAPRHVPAFSLSALERYQDCPFKYFAADVLRLDEAPKEAAAGSPRVRGRFVHELFQEFFAAWDREAGGAIAPSTVDQARRLFAEIAEPFLARLPEAEAALERTRLFGSAISLGIVDIVLNLEAARPGEVMERLLEHRFDGPFALGASDGRRVRLRGVADRIDVLSGHRLRVIDYKSGSAPNPKRALQVPIYALCAQEHLSARDGTPWIVDEAAYVAFSGRRPLVSVVKSPADAAAALGAARSRLFEAVEGIGRGEFPPRPYDPTICRSCAYSSVCRKDYADDD